MTEKTFVTRPGLGRGDTNAELSTLVAVLRHHATHFPDDTAITFLVDGESKKDVVSFGELDRRARAIAMIVSEHAKPGDRALLLFPPGMNYITAFFGALYAGVIAGTAVIYLIYTLIVAEWRKKFQRATIDAFQESARKFNDAMNNVESVKNFTNETYEFNRYDKSMTDAENASVRDDMSALAFGVGQGFLYRISLIVLMVM